MDASLNQPSRVQDDGPMGCKLLFYAKKHSDVSELDGSVGISIANSVPAAAVIRRMQALSGFIGLKGAQVGL